MPNIYGKHSLTEIAGLLGVTPAFINRIQRETGIGGKLGNKGEPSFFSPAYAEIFKRIRMLRELDFSFKDIREIWGLEEQIASFCNDILNAAGISLDGWSEYSLLLHADEKIRIPGVDAYDSKDKRVREYMERVSEHLVVTSEVRRRWKEFDRRAGEISRAIGKLAAEWDGLAKKGMILDIEMFRENRRISKNK